MSQSVDNCKFAPMDKKKLKDDLKKMEQGVSSLMQLAESMIKDLPKEELEKVQAKMPEIQKEAESLRQKITEQKERYGRIFREFKH